MLLYDNVCPHALPALEHLNWELFDRPPNSPDLAASNYSLFTYLKNRLWSKPFNNIVEIMEGSKRTWAHRRQTSARWDKYLSRMCDYVEK
jgi:hypothetical protein